MPELEREMREAGFDEDRVQQWLRRLAPMVNVPETSLVALAKPEAQRVTVSPTRRQLTIWRHQVSHWWNHGGGIFRVIYGIGWLTLLGKAIAAAAVGWMGYALGLVVLLGKLKFVIGEWSPRHLPLLQRTNITRQLLLKKLMEKLQRWHLDPPNAFQLREFQTDSLKLIVTLVRDHRSDLDGRRIFANLLVRKGEDAIWVIARADDTRLVPKAYSRTECSIAWRAFETGVSQESGDVYEEEPHTELGKTYNSVFAIPVKLNHQVVAVVSIDSDLKHHFYKFKDELQNLVGPYVQLLASTLPPCVAADGGS
jgi:hypothetical protein